MEKPNEQFERNAELVRVIDGDTLVLRIDLGWGVETIQHIRLSGLNAPESQGRRPHEHPAGEYVTKKVKDFLLQEPGRKCIIHSIEFEIGSFGRCLCNVWVGDKCLNEWLLDEGLAWGADSKGKLFGARDVSLLHGIPEEVQEAVAAEWTAQQ